MIVLNLARYHVVEKFGEEGRRVVCRARDEQLDRYSNERARLSMRILNLGLVLVLSASVLWAQTLADKEYQRRQREEYEQRKRALRSLGDLQRVQVPSKKEKAAKELKQARKDMRKKKYEKALRRLKKATELYPQYAEPFYEIGRIYLRQNRKEETRKAFEQAIARIFYPLKEAQVCERMLRER